VSRRAATFRRFFAWALRHELCRRDPLAGHTGGRVRRQLPRPIRQYGERRALDAAMATAPQPYRLIFTILRETGLRPGEVLAPRRGDVTLDAGREALRVREPKNGTERTVVLGPTATPWTLRASRAYVKGLRVAARDPFQLVIGGGHFVPALLPVTLSAFLAYVVGYLALLKMASGLLEEVKAGTLEQAHLSPLRPWVLALGRRGAALIEALLTALIVGAVLALVLGIHLPFQPAALIPLVTTLADVAGFALLIAGLALVVTSIGALMHVNGALIPVSAYPPGVHLAAKLVPTALAMDTTRRILFGHEALARVWADHSLP
jgi:hypothetical protein